MNERNGIQRLVKEAHRRSLWQVMILYLGASWGVLEAADHVIQRFGMPDWAYGTAVLLLLIGFPIVMATAIVQEGVGGRDGPATSETTGPGADGPTADTAVGVTTAGLAPASSTRDPASPARPGSEPSTIHRLLTWRNAILGGVAAFGLWGLVATVLLVRSGDVGATVGRDAGTGETARKAIAVLPFENLSADADNAYFADGIHEDVLTQLSKIGDLTVISRTSVLPYRETDKSLREIAAELEVGSILEGSVRRSGENVRITAQLIDAETDQHLWADNFDRGLTAANVFAIQTEIARRIADALRATLSPREESRIAHVPTANLSAYDLYIRGREAYQRYQAEDNEAAIRLFREAIAADSTYADPWAGLADGYFQRVQLFGYPVEWADSAEALARRSIELNPEAAAGYKALSVALGAQNHIRAALDANLAAIERDPNHYAAVNNTGTNWGALGRYDEAIRWYKRSARLNPTAFGTPNTVSLYALLGDADLARRQFTDLVDRDPFPLETRVVYDIMIALYAGDAETAARLADSTPAELQDNLSVLVYRAAAYATTGNLQRVRELAQRALELSPGASLGFFFDVRTFLGYATMRTTDEEEGRAILNDRAATIEAELAAGADRPAFFWELAAIHAALGESEESVRLATQGREAGVQPAMEFLQIEPMMEAVRDDPRIVALVEDSRRDLERQRQRVETEEVAAGLR